MPDWGYFVAGAGRVIVYGWAETPAGQVYATADSPVVVIEVKTPQQLVTDLIALVQSYNLGQLGTALHEKLVNVQTFLAANKPQRACNVLDRFIAQVKEQRGKRISIERADRLILDARHIKTVIGC